ncbi:MAG: corrinoid protein [Candidatus Bathyarchaeia archaeon]
MSEATILKELSQAIIDCDSEKATEAIKKAIAARIHPLKAIEQGLAKGLKELGDMFGRTEVFLPELIVGADIMKTCMEILEPELRKSRVQSKKIGRYLIGTVHGDIHNIGKDIVATLLTLEGFEVIDLGVDVSTATFVEKVRELQPDILGMSALLTTSILAQGEVIEALNKANLRDKVKIMVGGAPVTEEHAKRIGADAYSTDGFDAVKKAKALIEKHS